MKFLLAGLPGDEFGRDFQILDAAGDIGIAGGAARLAVIFVIHGPAVEPVTGERVHHGIFALAGDVEIEHPRGHRRAMDKEHHRPRRLTGLRRADPLAEHPQGNVALFGPVFAAPDLAAFRGYRGRGLRRHCANRARRDTCANSLDDRAPCQRRSGSGCPELRHGCSPLSLPDFFVRYFLPDDNSSRVALRANRRRSEAAAFHHGK